MVSLLEPSSDRSGELLSLCLRQQWSAARALLALDSLSATTISSALEHAVTDGREGIAAFVLREAPRTRWDINAPVHKDGRTLLHVAAERHSPPLVRALLDAGADWAVADKRGVRAADLAGWTDAVHSTVAVPLRDSICCLERNNSALRAHVAELIDRARLARDTAAAVRSRVAEVKDGVDAIKRFRQSVDAEVDTAKTELAKVGDALRAAPDRLDRLKDDIRAVDELHQAAMTQVEAERRIVHALDSHTRELDAQRMSAEQQRSCVAAATAVKGEVVGLMRTLLDSGALDSSAALQTIRALLALGSKTESRRQLQCSGAPKLAVDLIERFATDADVVSATCRLLAALGGCGNETLCMRAQAVLQQVIDEFFDNSEVVKGAWAALHVISATASDG